MDSIQTSDVLGLPWEARFREHMVTRRLARDISQTKLAKLLRDEKKLPFHQQTVQKVESGERALRLNEAIAIADVLETDLEQMLGGEHATALSVALDEHAESLGELTTAAITYLETQDYLREAVRAASDVGAVSPERIEEARAALERPLSSVGASARAGAFAELVAELVASDVPWSDATLSDFAEFIRTSRREVGRGVDPEA